MSITVELSTGVTNRLQADAAAMDISSEALLAELATKICNDTEPTEEDHEIVALVQEAVARYDARERGLPVDEAFAELERRAEARRLNETRE